MDSTEKLEIFLSNNENTKINEEDGQVFILNPWEDPSIIFVENKTEVENLADNLVNLILPKRFTAIYHIDKKCMEFIYTLMTPEDELLNRKFSFYFKGIEYKCKFDKSTDRLLYLGKIHRPTGKEPIAGYRNLTLFKDFIFTTDDDIKSEHLKSLKELIPLSFYIENINEFSEKTIIEISKHLNLFLTYYDRESADIMIHSEKKESAIPTQQLSLIENKFPESISCGQKDEFLLDFLLAANEVETRMSFIYYYQVLEYAAFYYIDSEVKKKLYLILNSPTIHSSADITQLTNVIGRDERAIYSPNGDKIAFESGRNQNTQIYVMNIDGSNVQNLSNSINHDYFPQWSPDGTLIAYLSYSNENASKIRIMSSNGKGNKLLSETKGYDTGFDWY